MNRKAAIAGAALAAVAYAIPHGASRSEIITLPSHVDGGTGSDVGGFDPPATGGHPGGGADSLALDGSSTVDPMAPRSGGESGDDATVAVGSIVDPGPSALTWLVTVFSDLRARIFGGP